MLKKKTLVFVSRMMSLQKYHTAYPVTGAVATAAEAETPDTVVNKVIRF